jgi:hypothetical protein
VIRLLLLAREIEFNSILGCAFVCKLFSMLKVALFSLILYLFCLVLTAG